MHFPGCLDERRVKRVMGKRGKRCRRAWPFRIFLGLIKLILLVLLIFVLAVAGINGYMMLHTTGKVLTQKEAASLEDVDAIVVLGASVHGKKPSSMLQDRLDTALGLYDAGVSHTLIMSGDGSKQYYDEAGAMKLYAMEYGVDESYIKLDHMGLCTYDSMKHVKETFQAKKIVIVTQRYHIYRALYIAGQMGMEAYGVSSDLRSYSGQQNREIREIAARCKDFIMIHLGTDATPLFQKFRFSEWISRTAVSLAEKY